MPNKVEITHPKLKDWRGRPVTVHVWPRQAEVLAESGWVPVEQPAYGPEQPAAARPVKKAAAPKTDTNKE